MKQLYYTSCVVGRSVSGSSGFQVRAVSTGVPQDRIRAAIRYVDYSLSSAMNPDPSITVNAPIKLALLNTRQAGRLLCHSVYAGRDPTTGRFGNFFTHLFLDVPPMIDALAAIRSWESPSWRQTDGDFAAELPEFPDVAPLGVLYDCTLVSALAAPTTLELFRFALTALLLGDENDRVILVAPSRVVVDCVHALTRVLPAGCLARFSFSTYESEPLHCEAKLIGAFWEGEPDRDLASSCYSGTCRAFNTISGRRSELNGIVPFVDFAENTIRQGKWAVLDRFLDLCNQLQVDDGRQLSIVDGLENQRESITKDHVVQSATNRVLTQWLLQRPDAHKLVIEEASANPAFAMTVMPNVVNALDTNGEPRRRFVETAIDHGRKWTTQGDLDRINGLFNAVLPAFPPNDARSVRLRIIDSVSSPITLPAAMYSYMIAQLAQDRTHLYEQTMRWLEGPPRHIKGLLDLDLPRPWEIAACKFQLRGADPPPELMSALEKRTDLALELLRDSATNENALISLFSALLRDPNHDWIGALFEERNLFSDHAIDTCLTLGLKQDVVYIPILVQNRGRMLAKSLARGKSLRQIVDWFLNRPDHDSWENPAVHEFLCSIASNLRSYDFDSGRLIPMLSFRSYIKRPTFDDRLEAASGLFSRLPVAMREPMRNKLLSAIVAALVGLPPGTSESAAVEQVLQTLGGPKAEEQADLYRELIHRCEKSRGFWHDARLLAAFLAVGFGSKQPMQSEDVGLSNDCSALGTAALEFAHKVQRRARTRVLFEIDNIARAWPDQTKARWLAFKDSVSKSRMLGWLTKFFKLMTRTDSLHRPQKESPNDRPA